MTDWSETQRRIENMGKAEDGPMFWGAPERWLDDPHWRCQNNHVSTTYLKSEMLGALCLACHEPLVLTFPEDKDGPMRPSDVARINHYIHTQQALGNWPEGSFWAGDDVIVALADTYDHIGADQIMELGARWAITGDWGWG